MNERQVSNKALELAEAMEIRASIRRKATSRKSVQEGANDRLADQLEAAATMLRSQEKYINQLHKLLNYNGIGAGKDLLTGEVIPFEVNE